MVVTKYYFLCFKNGVIWTAEREKSFHLSLIIFGISEDVPNFYRMVSKIVTDYCLIIFEKREKANDDRPTNASERFPKITRSQTKEHSNVSLTDHYPIMSYSNPRRTNTCEHFSITFIVIDKQAVPTFSRSLLDHFRDHSRTSTSENVRITLWQWKNTLPKVSRRFPDHFLFSNRTHPNVSRTLTVTKSACKSWQHDQMRRPPATTRKKRTLGIMAREVSFSK